MVPNTTSGANTTSDVVVGVFGGGSVDNTDAHVSSSADGVSTANSTTTNSNNDLDCSAVAAAAAAVDAAHMQAAIVAAEAHRVSAPPNPWVGCVLVDPISNRVLGKGAHERAGTPHAEVNAVHSAVIAACASASSGIEDVPALRSEDWIARARSILAGCTVYTTLEPCHHTGRTPPCDALLRDIGAARVVVGALDPDVRVRGSGVALLRSAGIVVDVVGEDDSRPCPLNKMVSYSLRPYLHQRRARRPWVLLKAARTMDGSVSCMDGTSQWITGPESRSHAHGERAASQAILVGSGTALIDNPRLNVRGDASQNLAVQPLRVVLDGSARVCDKSLHLLDTSSGSGTLIVTRQGAPRHALDTWASCKGVEVMTAPAGRDGYLDLGVVLDALGKRGILQVLVEGGPTLYGQLLACDLVDEMILYTGAALIGGTGRRWLPTQLAATMADVAFRWQPIETKVVPGSRDTFVRYVHESRMKDIESEAARLLIPFAAVPAATAAAAAAAAGGTPPAAPVVTGAVETTTGLSALAANTAVGKETATAGASTTVGLFADIPSALAVIRSGGMVVVMDDESRENEGDLIMAAQFCTPEAMACIIRYTSGIVCVPMTTERAKVLRLPSMVGQRGVNEDPKGTAYTVSCDFVGSHTGISAAERARTATILAAVKPDPEQISRPGHIFPLVARAGGVLERRGHTEAAVDLCRLAGVEPVGVISELMNDDGSTALLSDCVRFARAHNLLVITVDDLAAYRRSLGPDGICPLHESFNPPPAAAAATTAAAAAAIAIEKSHDASLRPPPPPLKMPLRPVMKLAASCTIPVVRQGRDLGKWQMQLYLPEGVDSADSASKEARLAAASVTSGTVGPDVHMYDSTGVIAMVKLPDGAGDGVGRLSGFDGGDVTGPGRVVTSPVAQVVADQGRHVSPVFRLHSQCMTGDLFGSTRCDCGEQLTRAFSAVAEAGAGAVVYIPGHEGRGIGLLEKVKAYHLMEQSADLDTYAANRALGHDADLRSYAAPGAVLQRLYSDYFCQNQQHNNHHHDRDHDHDHAHGHHSLHDKNSAAAAAAATATATAASCSTSSQNQVTLLTGNPQKAVAIADILLMPNGGCSAVRVMPLTTAPSLSNSAYLAAKSEWQEGAWKGIDSRFAIEHEAETGDMILTAKETVREAEETEAAGAADEATGASI
eukprot:UC1_evm2s304